MLKRDFLNAVSDRTGVKRDDINMILTNVREVVKEVITSADSIKIFDGLTLSGEKMPKAKRRNPATGESIIVPPRIRAKARFSQPFKDEINNK